MKKEELLAIAIKIASDAHCSQIDKASQPYVLHPLRVMFALDTTEEKIVGVLHDVIEDTPITYSYLEECGFKGETEILDALKSVTREENETYDEFINRAALNPIGRKVKLADLDDNMNLSRIASPTEKDYKRLEKYKKAKERLLNS